MGKKIKHQNEKRSSVIFYQKRHRFFTVGASGIGVNYLVSMLFSSGLTDFWYVHANIFGIIASISTNFYFKQSLDF